MKKKIVSIFVCMLMFVAVSTVTGTMNINYDTTDGKTNPFNGDAKDPGDILWVYDVEADTGDNQCLGVEFDGTYFYVTGGGAAGVNKLHFFESDGTYITSINQGTTSDWGWRDIAFDGNHMYSGDESGLKEWIVTGLPDNPELEVVGSHTGAPTSPNRALAYDPATGHFWTANFGSNIWEFSLDGTIHNTYSNTYAIYGMAWDDISMDGPWLWIYSQDGSPAVQISQFDPINGVYTGLTYVGEYNDVGDMAGGACFIDRDGLGQFVGLTQNTPDLIFGMEICLSNQPPDVPNTPEGPDNGIVGLEYEFTTSTDDPDEDMIVYGWDFDGDMVVDVWTDFYDSGDTCTVSYTWDEPGDFNIRVKAKDTNGLESGWSAPHAIEIIEAPDLEIDKISGKILKVKAELYNGGAADANGVSWEIGLEGGIILLGGTTTGTINIPAGQSKTIESKIILGLGSVTIRVTLTHPLSSATDTKTAFVLGILIL